MKEETVNRILSAYEAAAGKPCRYQAAREDPAAPPCAFCRLIQRSPAGAAACRAQQLAACERAEERNGYHVLACHAGLVEWVVPVREEGRLEGWFHAGFAVSSGDGREKIEFQEKEYLARFGAEEEEFREALDGTDVVSSGKFAAYASLLAALTRICGESEAPDTRRTAPDIRDIVYFEGADAGSGPHGRALSSYVFQRELDREEMTAFWKAIEVRASAVFTELMSGRGIAARQLFEEIMALAYAEEDPETAKISAEMLFHIIFLKYYGKDVYDVRFYRLAFETIRRLFEADGMDRIRRIMNASFDEMYGFYNAGAEKESGSRAVQTIMDYLERNYASDIRVADAAAAAYLSPDYASRLVKKETSFTIKWALNQIRMRHAQELLVQTRMPVAEISRAVGYRDTRGFYKMFTKHFGITCTEMRSRFSGVERDGGGGTGEE